MGVFYRGQGPRGTPAKPFLHPPGNFKAGDLGHVLKRHCSNEQQCLERLEGDALQPYVPAYYGMVEHDGEPYIQMEDLLSGFENPSIMDCKMGVR